VPVPLDLFEHLLFYIWSARAELVATLFRRRRNYKAHDALFLSLKTGKGLKRKSIGNLVNATFIKLHIPGSAHRLRAAFAESVVRDCYLRARGAHGNVWDRNAVLLEAAEALGHKSTRSLRYYLNRIIREFEIVQGEAILLTSPSHAEVLRKLVSAVNNDDVAVVMDLYAIHAKHKLASSPRTDRNEAPPLDPA
jgi:hypothetical protein